MKKALLKEKIIVISFLEKEKIIKKPCKCL